MPSRSNGPLRDVAAAPTEQHSSALGGFAQGLTATLERSGVGLVPIAIVVGCASVSNVGQRPDLKLGAGYARKHETMRRIKLCLSQTFHWVVAEDHRTDDSAGAHSTQHCPGTDARSSISEGCPMAKSRPRSKQ